MKNTYCKACDAHYHYCSSCDADDWAMEYCSFECYKPSYEQIVEKYKAILSALGVEKLRKLHFLNEEYYFCHEQALYDAIDSLQKK